LLKRECGTRKAFKGLFLTRLLLCWAHLQTTDEDAEVVGLGDGGAGGEGSEGSESEGDQEESSESDEDWQVSCGSLRQCYWGCSGCWVIQRGCAVHQSRWKGGWGEGVAVQGSAGWGEAVRFDLSNVDAVHPLPVSLCGLLQHASQ